ncbi:MAG TPA: LacI family DNA-binding transcriptional regulator [Solirubrobacteraceae bacterium]|nr:LacI family DNA-binding transcriptional regulator [Solirubrobacteraceae bacterium]
MPRRPNIHELARLSGVSVGTVSRALNGYADVRAETRERIMRIAEELDYTPAAAARTLVTQRSHVVGVFLETGEGHPDLTHPFFHEVLTGIKEFAGPSGYDLLLFASERPGNGYGPHSYLKRCRHHNVDGAVLMGMDAEDPEVRRLVRSDVATVGVDLELAGPLTTSVASDNEAGSAAAVRHLHELGHRRIAHITGQLDKRPGADRLRGYRHELQRLGVTPRDEYVTYGDFYVETGYSGMQALLALDEPPTAIVAAADLTAIGAIRAAVEAGLEVPRDLSVVGFDDIQLAEYLQPPLTTLRQAKSSLGAEAGRALVSHIEGEHDVPAAVTLPVELVVRASTTPPTS